MSYRLSEETKNDINRSTAFRLRMKISKLADQLFDRQCREIGHHEKFMSLISSIFVEKSEDSQSKVLPLAASFVTNFFERNSL